MIGILLALINPLVSVATEIAKYKTASLNATTDQARIAADERVKALEAKRDVMVAEGSFTRLNAITRTALAFGPVFILNKIFVWDKALGLGSTDRLDANLWYVIMTCVGFYFVSEIASRFKR